MRTGLALSPGRPRRFPHPPTLRQVASHHTESRQPERLVSAPRVRHDTATRRRRMALIELARDGAVFVLTMESGENRFNRPFVDALNAALDSVEASTGPAALVTTGGDKFYS